MAISAHNQKYEPKLCKKNSPLVPPHHNDNKITKSQLASRKALHKW